MSCSRCSVNGKNIITVIITLKMGLKRVTKYSSRCFHSIISTWFRNSYWALDQNQKSFTLPDFTFLQDTETLSGWIIRSKYISRII